MAKTELEGTEERYRQVRARHQALKDREATKQRKLDTRRKVTPGAALLDRLIRNLFRDQDKQTFEGWDQPRSTAPCTTRVDSAGFGI